MSFELVRKSVDYEGFAGYYWKYSPIKDMKDGWEKVFGVIGGLGGVDGDMSFDIEGPYEGEKEFRDIGWKKPKSLEDLKGMLGDLISDENYSGNIFVSTNDGGVKAHFQIIEEGKYIGFLVTGKEKGVKLVSTVIKKALG